MKMTKAEILTILKRLVDSLKREPFFPGSEKYEARARAQEILDKTEHTGDTSK